LRRGVFAAILSGSMKTRWEIPLLFLAAMFLCGCTVRRAVPVYHAGDEKPPAFLLGPVAQVLTNLDGFSAHVTATTSVLQGTSQTTSGELLGREGQLLFQPAMAIKGKRARQEGGLFFIWDESKHSGYVLSEALQGYAPIQSDLETTGQISLIKESIQEEVNGHPCHRCEAVVPSNDGLMTRLTLWQADDARHFPVRIEWIHEPERMTLDFSEIRLEYPAQELFQPPDGFTAYASGVALINELIVRDSALNQKYQTGELGEPADVQSDSWHQPEPGMR
jgi:hypothetical protein